MKSVKRGSAENDEKEFRGESLQILHQAAKDLSYLLNHNYKIKGASVFVGNHYLLSERQRLAVVRAIVSGQKLEDRKSRERKEIVEGSTVNIDGFNTIITLEVAFSHSVLLRCMDGTIRDLAGLRGTYRIIDKTQLAIRCIGEQLEKRKAGKAIFYLDAPVSNSGRLKEQIYEQLSGFSFDVQVEVINNVDSLLETKENVVTSDGIILDKCISWINLSHKILEERKDEYWIIDITTNE